MPTLTLSKYPLRFSGYQEQQGYIAWLTTKSPKEISILIQIASAAKKEQTQLPKSKLHSHNPKDRPHIALANKAARSFPGIADVIQFIRNKIITPRAQNPGDKKTYKKTATIARDFMIALNTVEAEQKKGFSKHKGTRKQRRKTRRLKSWA